MKKRIMALMMVMAVALTGCSNTSTSEKGTTETESEDSSPASETEGESSVLKDGVDTELLVAFPGSNSSPKDIRAVEEAINEIVSETMDAHVTLQIIEFGAYNDQCNLMLSGGEKLDLLLAVNMVSNFANRGQLEPITELITTYAPNTNLEMKKYLDACYLGEDIYGIPTFHDYAIQTGFVCRADIVEELSLDMGAVKSLDDLGEIFAAVSAAYPNMNLVIPGSTNTGVFGYLVEEKFDISESGVGVVFGDESGKIVNIYETEEFKDICKKAKEWYDAGYIMRDAATNTEIRQSLMKAGNSFGYLLSTKPGIETQETSGTGMDMVNINFGDTVLGTSRVPRTQWVVPTACESPEKAVAFLELLYSNADIANLMLYGVEGLDYVVTDADNGQISYVEGEDSTSVGWSNEDWLVGNAAITYTFATDSAAKWDDLKEFNDNANVSSLYGFTYDNNSVKNEITAISNVLSKYELILTNGQVEDVDAAIIKLNEELAAAGVQNIIDDMNEQVQVWEASK